MKTYINWLLTTDWGVATFLMLYWGFVLSVVSTALRVIFRKDKPWK